MPSLEDIPVWFADAMDINLATAQVILSIVVILTVLLPTMYLSSGSRSTITELAMFFLTTCLLVGIGWLSFWILIAFVAVLALAVATLGAKMITGD